MAGNYLNQPAAAAATPPKAPTGGVAAKTLLEHAKGSLGNRDALYALLAAAGVGGTLGGVLSARAPAREGESKAQRRKRIILNALGSGAAGAGGVAGGLMAKSLITDEPKFPKGTPVVDVLKSPIVRGPLAAAGGAYGAISGAKSEAAELRSGLAKSKPSADLRALGVEDFSPETLNRELLNEGGEATTGIGKGKTTRPVADLITEDVGRAFRTTADGGKKILRGAGHHIPGSNRLMETLGKLIDPRGAAPGMMGMNRRWTRGGAGATLGFLAPSLITPAADAAKAVTTPNLQAPAEAPWYVRPWL